MGTRRKFGWMFKFEVVKRAKGRSASMADAARDMGVHENVLRKWVPAFA